MSHLNLKWYQADPVLTEAAPQPWSVPLHYLDTFSRRV